MLRMMAQVLEALARQIQPDSGLPAAPPQSPQGHHSGLSESASSPSSASSTELAGPSGGQQDPSGHSEGDRPVTTAGADALHQFEHVRPLVENIIRDFLEEDFTGPSAAAEPSPHFGGVGGSASSAGPSASAAAGPATRPSEWMQPEKVAFIGPPFHPRPSDEPLVCVTFGNWKQRQGRYHRVSNCVGLRKAETNIIEVWRSQAIANGHTPCLLCLGRP